MFYSDLDRLYKKCTKCIIKDKITGICRETILFYTKIQDNQKVLKNFWNIEKCFNINCIKHNKYKKVNLNEIIKEHNLYTFTSRINKTE